jgi:hypothetical protein
MNEHIRSKNRNRKTNGLVMSDEALMRWYEANKEFVDSERARLFDDFATRSKGNSK